MAQQTINGIIDGIIGGYQKINAMFSELYASILQINVKTTSYTLVLTDAGKKIKTNISVSANTITIPPSSSVNFAIGTRIIIRQMGSGTTSIVAGSGVTINSVGGGLSLSQQYNEGILCKEDTDTWSWISGVTIPVISSGEKALTVTSVGAQTNYDIQNAPVSATALGSADFSIGTAIVTGLQGQWAYDANYFYFCVGTNTWIRLANTSALYAQYLSVSYDDSAGIPTTASLNTAYPNAVNGQMLLGTTQGYKYEKISSTKWVKTPATTI